MSRDQNISSDLFPDLDINCPPATTPKSAPSPAKPKSTESCDGSESSRFDRDKSAPKTTPTLTAKQILLKYQCMPLYPTMEESREELDSFMERYNNQVGGKMLPNMDGNDAEEADSLRDHVIILHSLFSKFCTPPPSVESVCNVVILESRRVAALGDSDRGLMKSALVSDAFKNSKDLPKEPLVHTSASSAQFVIALLKSPPKRCLLALPLEFQLSFFRLLMRILSEESDEVYDDECLFDWSFIHDANNEKASRVSVKQNERDTKTTYDGGDSGRDVSSETELGGSYQVVHGSSSSSLHSSDKTAAYKTTASSQTRSSFLTTDIANQAWNYGSWTKKKSAPLYSAIRFCSSLGWEVGSTSSPATNVSQRQRWDYVADNVKLDEEEEKELNSEQVFEDTCSRASKNGSMKLVGILIKIYQSILEARLREDLKPNARHQYLLLGPVAHLLGLIVSAVGISVKDLRKLLVIAEGPESNLNLTKDLSRRPTITGGINTKALQQTPFYLARLHVVRLLRYAAEYSTQSTGILDKVGPRSFFSFGDGGQGLSASLINKPWPFRHDFGMACWFRAESFHRAGFRKGSGDDHQSTVLFRARTQDGGQIEISFESSCSGGSDDLFATAATLLVTVRDAREPNVQKIPRKVRLVGCVLSPLVWYHVGVRLTKTKPSPFSLNFSKTNELSIFINGKLMLRTHMKLPRFPETSSGSFSGSLASVGFSSFGRPAANGSKTYQPIELTFLSNFDGQAGALYVFDELVSDETIQLLYHDTARQSDQGAWFSFSDGWDAGRSKLMHIAKALSSASMLSELEDVLLPDYPILIGTVARERKRLIDVPEDCSSTSAPMPKANLGTKPLLVWDPSRILSMPPDRLVAVDLHSGINGVLSEDVLPWSDEERIKETLLSLGGPKRLIPLFSALRKTSTINHPAMKGDIFAETKGVNQDFPNMLMPGLLFLVASFIRESGMNARELYRCGAIHVIHKILHDCKRREVESSIAYYGMGSSLVVAKLNVSALLCLWQSSRQVFGLEIIVFTQLLFNVTLLLLGGVSTSSGIHLYGVLLPVLSEITRQNPEKVRDCVGTKLFFDCIREYSKVESSRDKKEGLTAEFAPFERPSEHDCSDTHLTIVERRIVVDFLLGMVTTMLTKSCPMNDLSPLLTFLSHDLDAMWQQDNQNAKNNPKDILDARKRKNCNYLALLKTANVLYFLLQKSPPVPYLIESLTSLLENADSVASWVLCCMVNQFDDALRGLGVRCLAAYLHSTLDFSTGGPRDMSFNHQNGSTVKLSNAVKYGLGVISQSSNVLASILAGRGNVQVIYKLLFHLLKCHRDQLGEHSNSGIMYLLVDDSSISLQSTTLSLTDIVVPNKHSHGGVLLDIDSLSAFQSKLNVASTLSRQNIRNVYGVSTVLRLLRFMTNEQKERWLFDLLALILASPSSVTIVLSCDDWQPSLFQLIAEVLGEMNGGASDDSYSTKSSCIPEKDEPSNRAVKKFDTQALSKPSVRTRYDLSLKLYSSLLGHCVRRGDDKAFDAVETAASLQRFDVNGPEVFGIILSHLFADLIEKGTVESVEETYQKESPTIKNRALKQSARLVTQAILTNGSGGLDMTAAVKQWRSLRHLTALAVAVITDFGFGITELFDYQLQDAAAIDAITSGVYGIRLGDNLVSGINAFEALASAQLYVHVQKGNARSLRDRNRYVSVVLASQALTLLDAFIFPDNLDSSTSATQLHGLALVRSSEPRLGKSQGPLLASLVRLSLILLHFLEPCSVRFLQACSRLRCFLHWALEIIRESVALGGYSLAFHELTAPFDRIILTVVLHCHRALSRCSSLLVEIESSPWDKYFPDVDTRQKSHRRLFRAILELREIVLAAYRGRNEVLRASLSSQAHNALSNALESADPSKNPISREDNLRKFLAHDWVVGFHDVQTVGGVVIPESVESTMGKDAFKTLASESLAIIKDYKSVMNTPWKAFCENQRKWAETDAVREMEHTGDLSVKKLSTKNRADAAEASKVMMVNFGLASQRFGCMLRLAHDPWIEQVNWKFSSYTDLLFRRIVFSRIINFDDHRLASYELTLGKDRVQLQEEEKMRRQLELKEVLLKAGEAIVPYQESEDIEEDDLEDSFMGWSENDQHIRGNKPDECGLVTEEEIVESISVEEKSFSTETRDNKSDMDWDQLDFDETADNSDPYLWAKKFVWSEGEIFMRSFDEVLIVTLQNITKGTLLLTSHNLYFHQTGEVIDVMTKEKVETSIVQDRKWKLNRLTDVHGRRYMLKAQALELFFSDMCGVFIAFDGSKERDLFFSKLRTCKAPLLRPLKSLNPRTIFKKSKITELWRKRKLNNFQYLMALNLMAGRTFNDITQYPVFPWILTDYSSDEIDLTDHNIYRDLAKPVGALNPDRLANLIERFNELDGFPEEEKFLYGSHYSSPGVVLHYMVRQEPFTSMHIALQSGRFDCPDRLFFDLGGCWRSCLTSTSDVKELTPEFFTVPEIFLNTNAFPLGETQNKTPVDNVILPPWAKGSAHEFVRIHRLALESEYVSNHLHHWIDLIFGYKQRGPAAAEAHNIFHYLSYEGAVDIDKIQDEVQRSAIEGHIQNFGQTPSQLIVKDPHPSRLQAEPIGGLLSGAQAFSRLQCHTPTKQFGDHKYNEAHGAIISIQLHGDTIIAIHTDFMLCSYKLYPSRGTIPFHFKPFVARKIECRNSVMAQSSVYGGRENISDASLSPSIKGNSSQKFIGEWSFALAKGGVDKSDEPSSSIVDTSFFLMSIGYYDQSIKVHSTDSLQLHSSINGLHRGQISCIQASTDGTVVVTGGEDGTVALWVVDYEDFATSIADGVVQPGDERSQEEFLQCCHVLLGHTTPISCIAVCTKLDVVVSGAQDGSICLHNIRSGRFVRSFHIDAVSQKVKNMCAGNGIPVSKLAIHSDGIFVAHLCDGSLHVITVNGHHLASKNVGEVLNSILICPQSASIITGGEKGLVQMWNLHDLGEKCAIDVSSYGRITSMLLIPSETSPETQFLCVGSENGLLSVVFQSQEVKH